MKAGAIGTIQANTGFGKTIVAIKLIKRFQAKYKDARCYYIVSQTNQKNNALESLKAWGADLSRIEIFVINTFVIGLINNTINPEIDFLVLDELHRYGGEMPTDDSQFKFTQIWNKVKYKYCLGLSATLERLDNTHNFIIERLPVVDTITLQESLDNGWTSKYYQFNVPIDLSYNEKINYDLVEERFKTLFSIFNKDFDLMRSCMSNTKTLSDFSLQFYNLRKEKYNSYEHCKKEVKSYALACNAAMAERKKMVYNCHSKLIATLEIIQKLNLKFIIFGKSIDFVNKLSKLLIDNSISCAPYHSKMKKGENEKSLEKFKQNHIKGIVSASALDEGFDDDTVCLGINTSFTTNPTTQVQRIGRVVRLRADKKEKVSLFINLYCRNTQEEIWLEKSQKYTESFSLPNLEEAIPIIKNIYESNETNN